MANLDSHILLQQCRFNLIQKAAEETWDDDASIRTLHSINTRLESLELNWNKFQSDHETLCQIESDLLKELPYIKTKVFERCHEFYIHARVTLLSQRDELDTSRPSTSSFFQNRSVNFSSNHRNMLPRIKIPQFQGDYLTWASFRDLFTSIIGNNPGITDVEKMHYLKTCLSGEATRLISNLTLSDENFSVAWKALVTRYENKRFLISAQINKILNLKPLQPRSAGDLSLFLTAVTESLAALRSLGCPVHFWDAIFIQILVRLLDTNNREIWEDKLGSTSDFPTLKQFEDFLMSRIRVMENLDRQTFSFSQTKSSTNLPVKRYSNTIKAHIAATTSKEQNIVCLMCKDNHYLSRCPIYRAKLPLQRYEFVNSRHLCYNCLFEHVVFKCTSIRRCLKCGKKHHTTLHDSFEKSPSSSSVNKETRSCSNPEKENSA